MGDVMKEKLTQYGVWRVDNPEDGGYWMMFDTIEDAVSGGGDGTRVYKLEAASLGRFRRKVEIVKEKKKRRKQK